MWIASPPVLGESQRIDIDFIFVAPIFTCHRKPRSQPTQLNSNRSHCSIAVHLPGIGGHTLWGNSGREKQQKKPQAAHVLDGCYPLVRVESDVPPPRVRFFPFSFFFFFSPFCFFVCVCFFLLFFSGGQDVERMEQVWALTGAVVLCGPELQGLSQAPKRTAAPWFAQLFKDDLLTFWFCNFGLLLVEVPKG